MFENLSDFLDQNTESFDLPKSESSESKETIEYRPRPVDSKDEDGIYRSTIRIIQDIREQGQEATHNVKRVYFFNWAGQTLPWDIQAKNDPASNVFYTLKRSPNKKISDAVGDTSNPDRLFRMSIADYVLIQVINDKNKPELNGKFLIWKLPKAIKDMIQSRQNKKIQPGFMNPLLGFALNLEVTPGPNDPSNPTRATREIKYTSSEFDTDSIQPICKIDGTSFLSDADYDKLNELALNMNKVTKKGIDSVDKKIVANLTKQFDENKELIQKTIAEISEYITSLGDACPSCTKFCEPKPHTTEDCIRFVEMVSTYMKFIGATQDEVFTVLDRCKLLEYSVDAKITKTGDATAIAPGVGQITPPVMTATAAPAVSGSEADIAASLPNMDALTSMPF